MVVIININICDSERASATRSRELIMRAAWEMDRRICVTLYFSSIDLLRDIEKQFDALIINPTLSEKSGVEAARLIKAKHPDCVVFLLADDDSNILEGFAIPAYRYFVKSNVWEKLQHLFCDLIKKIIDVHGILDYRHERSNTELRAHEILYVKSNSGNVLFHTYTGEIISFSQRMADAENDLNKYGFIRIHKCLLVNIRHIESMKSNLLTLRNGESLLVSKARIAYVRSKLEQY